MIPHDELERRLKLIADTAPGMRSAGVKSLDVDGITVRYAPPYGPPDTSPVVRPDKPPDEPTQEPEIDALDDPETYGGEVPGYEHDEETT